MTRHLDCTGQCYSVLVEQPPKEGVLRYNLLVEREVNTPEVLHNMVSESAPIGNLKGKGKLTKNSPIAKRAYGFSLKADNSISGPERLGLSLAFMKILATSKVTSCTSAIALIVCGNPIFGRSWRTMTG